MHWTEKLKNRWDLKSTFQLVIVLVVFACTGFTVLFLKGPLLSLFGEEVRQSWVFTVMYFIFILPIYNIILLFYGFIFGQFRFFLDFEKKMFRRMFSRNKQG